jgi:hypothetical protein
MTINKGAFMCGLRHLLAPQSLPARRTIWAQMNAQ